MRMRAFAACALALALAACGARGGVDVGSAGRPVVDDAPAAAPGAVAEAAGSAAVAANASVADLPAATAIGTGDVTVRVTNGTGFDLAQVAVKPSSDEAYAEENSFSGFRFADGTTVELSFFATEGAEAYDLLLTTVDTSRIAVRGIDLTGLEDLTLCFGEGVGYVTFTDPATGETADNQAEAAETELTADTGPTYDMETQRG